MSAYGLSDAHAGLLAGTSTAAIASWKEEDAEFRDYLEMARAEFELNRTQRLLEATRPDGHPDWRAHAWLLKNTQQRDEAEARAARSRRASAAPNAGTARTGPARNTAEIPEKKAARMAAATETGETDRPKIPEKAGAEANTAAAAPPERPVPAPTPPEKIPENSPRPALAMTIPLSGATGGDPVPPQHVRVSAREKRAARMHDRRMHRQDAAGNASNHAQAA